MASFDARYDEFTDAVITDPLRPNVTLLPLLNVSAERLLLVVPAETLTADTKPATDGTV
jgi:hypothetical protein